MSRRGEQTHQAEVSASAALLSRLARSELGEVRRKVAANAHTPLPTLLALMEQFPEEVLANASLQLHLLADPSLLRALPQESAMVLAGYPGAPAWMLEQLLASKPWDHEALRPVEYGCGTAARAGHERLQAGWETRLARNPSTPAASLLRLALSPHREVRAEVAANPSTPPELLDLLRRAGSSPTLLRCTGTYGALTDDERTQLVEGGHWGRVLVAAHRDTPAQLRGELIRWIGEHDASTPAGPEELTWHHDKPELIRALLRSPALRPEEVHALGEHLRGYPYAGDDSTEHAVQAALARPPSPDWITWTLNFDHPWVRTLIASNVRTPGAVLLQLAFDEDHQCQLAATENPSFERALLSEPGLLASLSVEQVSALKDLCKVPCVQAYEPRGAAPPWSEPRGGMRSGGR